MTVRTIKKPWKFATPKNDGECCAKCGKQVNEQTCWWICVTDGGASLVHHDDTEEAEPSAGFLGCFAIGPDCATKIHKDFRWQGVDE